MRVTIHMVSARDYWPMTEAIRRARREWWLGATRRRAVERDVIETAERVRALLDDGPRRRQELMKELGVDSTTWNGVGMWLDLVRVPPSGTWDRRSADPVRAGRGLARPVGGYAGAGDRAPDPPLPRRVRPGVAQGPRELGRAAARCVRAGGGSHEAPPFRGRGRRGAPGPASRAAARSRHVRAGPVPPDVGRGPAGARAPNADPARAVPIAHSTPRPHTRDRRSWSTDR
jgi:hypothetical protein